MPVITPSSAARNLTPSSTAAVSRSEGRVGESLEDQIVHGLHDAATAAGALIATLSVAPTTAVAANPTTNVTRRRGKRGVAGPRCLVPWTDRKDGSTERTPRQRISEAPQIVTCIAGRISATSEPPTPGRQERQIPSAANGRNIPSPPGSEH